MRYLYYILRLFFTRKCSKHHWETISKEKHVDKYPVSLDYIRLTRELRCKNCGEIKFINHVM